MTKEYYLYVGGQKIKVSEQIYKVYWQEREHEKYLEQVDKYIYLFSLVYTIYKLDNSVKKLNTITIRKSFFHSRGLTMPKSRSPPFFVWKHKDKKEWRKHKWQKNITFMSVGKKSK